MGSIFQINESNGNALITGTLNMSSQQINFLADPTSAQDAATKNYVDALLNGLSWKNPVLAATTVAGTLASSFTNGSVIDGVTLATGNRILIKNQAAPAENGIYTVNVSGAPTRSLDMNTWAEVPAAATIVETGTVNADLAYVCTSDPGGTIGTTAITFVNFATISGGVTSITGTTNQVIVSTPTGAVTLSLPQSIATTSSPTFASITLTSPLTIVNGGTNSSTALANGKLMASSGGAIVESAITSTTTGSGSVVLATSPTLVTPALGTPSSATLTNATGLPLTTGVTGVLPNANTTATSNPTASTIVSRDTNSNTRINNIVENFTTTATAAGTTTLIAASSSIQQFTGSSTQTVTLPDATTLNTGFQFTILNRSSGTVSVNNNGAVLQQAMVGNTQTTFTCTNTGSANGTWDVSTSSAGGSTAFREDYVVGTALNNYTGSTTVFNLVNPYNVGGHSLVVTLDGDVQTVGATIDYLETNSTTVTFNNALVTGQKVSFIFQTAVSSSGIVNAGTAGQFSYYAASTSTISGQSSLTLSGSNVSLNSNKIVSLANGTVSTDAAAFGQLPPQNTVQVSNNFATSTTSSTYQAVTSFSVTITPTSASNRVKVTVSTSFDNGLNGVNALMTIKRGSTDLSGGLNNGLGICTGPGETSSIISYTLIDSPATTSPTTYQVFVKNNDNVHAVAIGRPDALSTIIVEEIV